MDDTSSTPPPPPLPTRDVRTPVRKILFAIGLLLISWLVFAQVIPRIMAGNFELPRDLSVSDPLPAVAPVAAPEGMPAEEENLSRQDVARLRMEIENLRTRVAELEEKQATAIPDTLLQRLEKLEERSAQAPLSAAMVGELQARIETSEKELDRLHSESRAMRSEGWQKVGMLAGLQQMEPKALGGQPFAEELEALRTLAQGNPQLTEMIELLAPLSASGVASQEKLQSGFNDAVKDALTRTPADASLREKLAGSLSHVITVRKVGGDISGGGDDAVIARAETLLKQNHLEAAVKELQALSPAAAPSFKQWLGHASDALLLRAQLDELHRAVLREIHRIETEPTP